MEKDTVPSVTKQGYPVRIISNPIGGYNSGVIEHMGELLFLSRAFIWEPTLRSKLIWQSLVPGENRAEPLGDLEIPGLHELGNAEDARVVRGPDGTIWIVFTEAIYDKQPWKVRMRVARIRQGAPLFTAELMPMIKFGMNGVEAELGSEKNWQLFFIGTRMFFSYKPYPHQVIEVHPESMDVIGAWNALSVQEWAWQYGYLSGGTPPIPWRGVMLSFYHGSMPHPKKRRRYFLGAFTFEPKPPFRVLEITPPLLRGSLNDAQSMDPPNHPGLPIVVFPMAAILTDVLTDTCTVSMGINDSYDALAQFKLTSLPWQSVRSMKAPRPFYFFTTDPSTPVRANQPRLPEHARFIQWEEVEGGGVVITDNPIACEDCRTAGPAIKEITADTYHALKGTGFSVV